MKVHFIRSGERRYSMRIEREGLPVLVMDPAPGFDPDLPHDMVHFVVEAALGLRTGVFGQIAAGGASLRQIADELKLNPKTVQSWKDRDKWDDAPCIAKIEDHLEARAACRDFDGRIEEGQVGHAGTRQDTGGSQRTRRHPFLLQPRHLKFG